MSGKLSKFGGIIILLAVGTIFLSTYIVDKTQYAIEILLGDPVDIVMEPGLNFKLPFVTRIIFMENRLQDYDADPGAVFTKDKKEMKVDTYSKWRVSDPLKFYETVRTTNGAHARLDDIIYSQTREVLLILLNFMKPYVQLTELMLGWMILSIHKPVKSLDSIRLWKLYPEIVKKFVKQLLYVPVKMLRNLESKFWMSGLNVPTCLNKIVRQFLEE